MSLKNAPKHIQLAVDLIDLLETNNIDTAVAIKALEIVLKDFKQKEISPKNAHKNDLKPHKKSRS